GALFAIPERDREDAARFVRALREERALAAGLALERRQHLFVEEIQELLAAIGMDARRDDAHEARARLARLAGLGRLIVDFEAGGGNLATRRVLRGERIVAEAESPLGRAREQR